MNNESFWTIVHAARRPETFQSYLRTVPREDLKELLAMANRIILTVTDEILQRTEIK